MATKPNKNQRRSVFIMRMSGHAERFALREVEKVLSDSNVGAELRAFVTGALAKAYVSGACAALDAEDGRPRDENVAP